MVIGFSQENLNRDRKYVLQQHDLLGTQLSPGSKRKAWLLNQMKTVIAAQLTLECQLAAVIVAAKRRKYYIGSATF